MMQAVFHPDTHELGLDLFEMIKKQFAGARIDIVVHSQDETDYLNSSEANRKALEESIREVEEGRLIVRSY
jgi:hypothetical protein